MKPTEKELAIINSLVSGWEREGNFLLCGGLSYEELFRWLKEMGADRPDTAIHEIEKLSGEK